MAITLAKLGQRVLVLEKQALPDWKLGESLTPSAVGLAKYFLTNLNCPDQQFTGLYSTVGNISLWANEQADIADFFFTSTGHGLCIDRLQFDEALRINAVASGATLFKGAKFQSCKPMAAHLSNWQVEFITNKGTKKIHARYLVDCSGRQAVVARALEIPILHHDDHLFAYAQRFFCSNCDDDRYTRIEAAPNGWWYSNRLPDTENRQGWRLVVFHSDKDLPAAKQAASLQGFNQLLEHSQHIAPLLKEKSYQSFGGIRGAPAHSQRLQKFCGNAWMAVGDAAQAYDPLSSQGIDKALKTACYAGYMLHYALSEHLPLGKDNRYIAQYDAQLQQLWTEYLSQRDFYYHIQRRWSQNPFWQRRRQNGSPK